MRMQMVDQTETLGLNGRMHEGFNCDDAHLELGNLVKDFGPIVGLILTPNGSFTFESIVMPNNLGEEIKIAWEVLKV
jgi:hypothetical protein